MGESVLARNGSKSQSFLSMKESPCVAIVVPCFNEEDVLPDTVTQLSDRLTGLIGKKKITNGSRIYFVDDGSRDKTWELIENFSRHNSFVHGIKLSRNRGHQNALLAGLMTAEGDVIISVDADLQDDPSVMENMVDHYMRGIEVVFGVRSSRTTDTWFKRWSAAAYYRLLKQMGVDIVLNHADYRLMSRRAIDALKEYRETNLFLRGMITELGFSTEVVSYKRSERFAGETKYPLRKMVALALDGVTSFSAVPLRIIAALGVLVFLISLGLSLWAIWVRLFTNQAVPGWASSVLPMYVLGGVQLLSLGIIGEYISKIFSEVKRRPRFIIEKQV